MLKFCGSRQCLIHPNLMHMKKELDLDAMEWPVSENNSATNCLNNTCLFLVYSLSCACYSLIIGKLIARFGAKKVYICGLLFYSSCMTLMALTKAKAR